MQVAIVDDIDDEAAETDNLLTEYCTNRGIPVSTTRFTNGEDFLQYTLEQTSDAPDLVFMDIEMPGLNGMDTARKIRAAGNDSVMIFTTRLPQYAMHGYEVDAIGYLLKPLDQYSFAMRMHKAVSMVAAAHGHEEATASALTLRYRGNVSRILPADILYVEVKGHYCVYHTVHGSFEVIDSLKTIAEQLRPLGSFFACSRYYLVNLARITQVDGDMIHLSGTDITIKVSRLKKAELLKRLRARHAESAEHAGDPDAGRRVQ